MKTFYKLVNIIRIENQQLEFIENCYRQGMCTAEEAFDKTVELLNTTDMLWKAELNKFAKEDNKAQAVNYN